MQETVIGIHAGGTETALSGITEGESHISPVARAKKFCLACASEAEF